MILLMPFSTAVSCMPGIDVPSILNTVISARPVWFLENQYFMGSNPVSAAECSGKLNAIGDALYVIGGKWKLRVVVCLREGNKRFNEIQRVVTGISARVLSNELKELEMNGFVKRIVHTQTPVVVEYELTDYADTLGDVLHSLSEWGAMHRDKIRRER